MFNFLRGPKGEQGPQGEQGAPGIIPFDLLARIETRIKDLEDGLARTNTEVMRKADREESE